VDGDLSGPERGGARPRGGRALVVGGVVLRNRELLGVSQHDPEVGRAEGRGWGAQEGRDRGAQEAETEARGPRPVRAWVAGGERLAREGLHPLAAGRPRRRPDLSKPDTQHAAFSTRLGSVPLGEPRIAFLA
jgi:hypothetical protein